MVRLAIKTKEQGAKLKSSWSVNFIDKKGSVSIFISLATVSFMLQAALFPVPFRPDEWKVIVRFTEFIMQSSPDQLSEIMVRVCLYVFNMFTVVIFLYFGVINKKTFRLAMIWPLTPFLFSKIYPEFFIFPFALIRHDLSRRGDLLLIISLFLLFLVTVEYNLFVIIAFRVLLLLIKSKLEMSGIILFVLFGVFFDSYMDRGYAQQLPVLGQFLERFNYIRDLVNPDYSFLETIGVIFSSFHFFSLHTGNWGVDFLFSFIVVVYIISSRISRISIYEHFISIGAFFAVVFLFSSVTHGFQNSRYYFFFLPLLAEIVSVRQYPALYLIGLLHIVMRASVLSNSDIAL